VLPIDDIELPIKQFIVEGIEASAVIATPAAPEVVMQQTSTLCLATRFNALIAVNGRAKRKRIRKMKRQSTSHPIVVKA
jgi:hypothetical protein